MINLYNNKNSMLAQKPQNLLIIFISLILILTIILVLIIKIKIYDNYEAKGIVECKEKCLIKSAIPSYISFEKMTLNNKFISYNIETKDLKIDEENFISYYEIALSTDEALKDQEIVSLNFYYNKESIISKIKQKMF